MAEKGGAGRTIPWTAVIAVLAATGGAFLHFQSLVSSRPQVSAAPGLAAGGYQDTDARLWQDPFRATLRRRELLHWHAATPSPEESKSESDDAVHGLCAIREQVARVSGDPTKGSVTVLAVMVQAAPYAELAEARLRTRVAVVEALARTGFEPQDTEHIGYFELPVGWTRHFDRGDADPTESQDGPDLVPYEWCRSASIMMPGANASEGDKDQRRRVLVLWLAEERFLTHPLARFASLIHHVQPFCKNVSWKLIGPRSSTGLRAMTLEAETALSARLGEQDSCSIRAARRELAGLCVYSPTSTAEDGTLLFRRNRRPSGEKVPAKTVADLLDRCWSIDFHRPTTTDKELSETIVNELELRGIHVIPACGRPETGLDHVAIVSELDTFYGRALTMSLAAKTRGVDVQNLLQDSKSFPSWLHPFVYLRGIDGRSPGDEVKTDAQHDRDGVKTDTRGGSKWTGPDEQPEGVGQADGLRRLAGQLAELDTTLRRRDGKGIRAVGVLGSDVYDKLLVLRALRDRLPGVTFFTTGIDARYQLPSELAATHNLICISPFGLRLHRFYQHTIPPFRDSYQTAVFLSTLKATGRDWAEGASLFNVGLPRRFEIGRTSVYELTIGRDENELRPDADKRFMETESGETPPPTVHPPRYDLANRFVSVFQAALIALIVLVLLFMLLRAGVRPSRMDVRQFLSMSPVAVLIACGIGAIGVVLVLILTGMADEPVAAFQGISVWPTAAIRLIAALLCVHFIYKSAFETDQNNREVEKRFSFKPLPGSVRNSSSNLTEEELHVLNRMEAVPAWRLDRWLVFRTANGIEYDSEEPATSAEPRTVDGQCLWWEYQRRRSSRSRTYRVAILVVIYLLICWLMSLILGNPSPRGRGLMARGADATILIVAVIASTTLTFFVLDSTYSNKRFIYYLAKTFTRYPVNSFLQLAGAGATLPGSDPPAAGAGPPAQPPQDAEQLGLDLQDMTEYADIRLIAMRTKVVGEVVYYPFVVFFLMVVARSSLFDDWDWPAGLLVILGGNMLLAVIGALMLRGSAEDARQQALQRLRPRQLQYLSESADPRQKARGEMLGRLIQQVEDERDGAFSLLSGHPFLAAVLLPSGSIGLWAILEYFAHSGT